MPSCISMGACVRANLYRFHLSCPKIVEWGSSMRACMPTYPCIYGAHHSQIDMSWVGYLGQWVEHGELVACSDIICLQQSVVNTVVCYVFVLLSYTVPFI